MKRFGDLCCFRNVIIIMDEEAAEPQTDRDGCLGNPAPQRVWVHA